MTRQRFGLALVLLLAVSFSTAHAEEFGGEGSYATMSGLVGISTTSSETRTPGGMSITVGAHAGPHFALEARWDWLDEIAHVLTMDAKVIIGTERVQPWLMAGLGGTAQEDARLTGAWRVGVGVDVFVTESWRITADVNYLDSFERDGEKGPLRHAVVGLGVGYFFY